MKQFPPIKKTLTPIVASRRLEIEVNQKKHKIRVELGTPIKDVETVSGLDWRCPFKISGFVEKVSYACGADSLQALSLALERIQIFLLELEAKYQTEILTLYSEEA